MIELRDNVLSYEVRKEIWDILQCMPIEHEEYDSPYDEYATGKSAEIPLGRLNDLMGTAIGGFGLSDVKLVRRHINRFEPKELAGWHIDSENGITVLYYPNLEFDPHEMGETLFAVDEDKGVLNGVMPIPGRFVIFDADIMHKATPFYNQPRYTIVYKFDRL